MIQNVVDTPVIKFGQAAYEEYHSSHSRSLSLSRTHRRIKIRAPIQARASFIDDVPLKPLPGELSGKQMTVDLHPAVSTS